MPTQWRATVDAVIELQGGEVDARPAPGLQWFPAQWLGDPAVQLMDWTARGLHHHLLMVSWKGFDLDDDATPASLPDDLELLQAICQHPDGWPALWVQISRAWKFYKGRWWNLGLCRSYLQQMKKRVKAKSSAEARWHREHANASPEHAFASDLDAFASKSDVWENPEECSSSSSASASSEERQERKKSVGDRGDLATDLEPRDPSSKKPKGPRRAEIAWRVADTWVHFLERRARYYRVAKGMKPPGSPPTMDDLIKTDIRRSLRVHDAELMGEGAATADEAADAREAWRRDSKTRAAGGGMYLTPWNLGKREEGGEDGNGKRATTYLEAWRPWRIRKSRDPVNEYAEMYFDKRAVAEAAEAAEEAERAKP